jgi:hypothetical protein
MQELEACRTNSPTSLKEHLRLQELEMTGNRVVRWKRDASQHPRNWATKRKVFDVTLVMFLDFFM